jgi:hypothetical protein
MALTLLALGLLLGLIAGQGAAQDAAPPGATAAQDLVGMAFTYQGKLNKGGVPHTGTCSLKFSLHDALSGGSQIGVTQTVATVDVVDGLFTVAVNDGSEFGGGPFGGEARWLAIAVQCAGDADYTGLHPRQELTPAPYALALPGLWTVQNLTSPNVFGGWQGNGATLVGIQGATIGGGGDALHPNQVAGHYATVAGGRGNQARNDRATIGGGLENVADGRSTTIGGGVRNQASGLGATIAGGEYITASGMVAAVGGGFMNTASFTGTAVAGGQGNSALAPYATVCGGYDNIANGDVATIGGGEFNQTSAHHATIGGGQDNIVEGEHATISGGNANLAGGPLGATIGGGEGNVARGNRPVVGGGQGNSAEGEHPTVSGGWDNQATGNWSTVGGGRLNTANGRYATVPGGVGATASHYGEVAHASGWFDEAGDAQTSTYVLHGVSTGDTYHDLFLNGTDMYLTIAEGRTVAFDILLVGHSSDDTSAAYKISGFIENVGGHTSLAHWNLWALEPSAAIPWDMQVLTNDTNHALQIQVKGNGETIRWVATVRTAEVAW